MDEAACWLPKNPNPYRTPDPDRNPSVLPVAGSTPRARLPKLMLVRVVGSRADAVSHAASTFVTCPINLVPTSISAESGSNLRSTCTPLLCRKSSSADFSGSVHCRLAASSSRSSAQRTRRLRQRRRSRSASPGPSIGPGAAAVLRRRGTAFHGSARSYTHRVQQGFENRKKGGGVPCRI